MDNLAPDIMDIMAAACKDIVSEDVIEKLHIEYNKLNQAEAECRRTKASALIISMAKLEMELTKFEYTYSKIAEKCGIIPAIEDYIRSVKTMLKRMSFEKNHL
jgi:hypothetical protein